jgi:hypothetical protein
MPLPFDPVERGYWDQSFQNILNKLDNIAEEIKKKKSESNQSHNTVMSSECMQK